MAPKRSGARPVGPNTGRPRGQSSRHATRHRAGKPVSQALRSRSSGSSTRFNASASGRVSSVAVRNVSSEPRGCHDARFSATPARRHPDVASVSAGTCVGPQPRRSRISLSTISATARLSPRQPRNFHARSKKHTQHREGPPRVPEPGRARQAFSHSRRHQPRKSADFDFPGAPSACSGTCQGSPGNSWRQGSANARGSNAGRRLCPLTAGRTAWCSPPPRPSCTPWR